MEKEVAKRILSSRTIINKPGKFQAKVTNVTLYDGHYIINTDLMNPYYVKLAQKEFAEGNYSEACNSNLTFNVWLNEETGEPRGYLPVKGEIVNVMTGFIETKSGEQALMITSLTEVKVSAGSKFSFDDVKEEVSDEVTASEEMEA